MIGSELRLEFFKLITKKRNYLAFLVFIILISLIYWAYRTDLHSYEMGKLGRKLNIDTLSYVNGPLLVEITIVPWLILLMPVFVSLLAGDQVASEMQSGTLRTILSRPVLRWELLIAKVLIIFFYIVTLILITGILGLIIGYLLLGSGDLLVLKKVLSEFLGESKGVIIIPKNQVVERYLWAYLIASWGALSLGSLGILLSVTMNKANTATVTTLVIYFMSHILAQVPFLYNFRLFFFTEHMLVWRNVFREIIPWVEIGRSCMYCGAFTFCFIIVAIAIFSLKDIKC